MEPGPHFNLESERSDIQCENVKVSNWVGARRVARMKTMEKATKEVVK